jgi:hypothetical protein
MRTRLRSLCYRLLVTGDLLVADIEALVNTVNTEGVIGKGNYMSHEAFADLKEAISGCYS